MKKIVMAFAVASTLISTQSFAADTSTAGENNGYAQIGITRARTEDSGLVFIHPVATATVGYNFNKNFAGEVMAGTSVSDDTSYYGVARITSSIDSVFGAYLKAKTEITPDLSIFARVGVLRANISATGSNGFVSASSSASDTSLSFGAGLEYNFTKTIYGQVDYMSLYNKSGTSSQGPSVSLGFNF
jgi:opacity protein-like surface antigen